MTRRFCLIILGKWGRILYPRHTLPQLPIPLTSEARSDFFVSIFLHAPLESELAPLEVVVYEPLVHPQIFLPAVFGNFLTSVWSAFIFCANLFFFFHFGLFLKSVDEDALAFAIAPNASIHALGIRNFRHYEDPLLELVFLSPPSFPSSSLTTVPQPSSSSYPSSNSSTSSSAMFLELSDDYDGEESPSWANENSSSFS